MDRLGGMAGRDVRSARPIYPTGTWGADYYRVAPAPGERVITKHQVVLLEDCAAALSKAEHDAAAHNVRTYFGRVAEAAAVERAWAEAARR